MTKWICSVAVVTIIFCKTDVYAGCNLANGTAGTLSITGGKAKVEDGESSTYTCTGADAGETLTWSLDPVGGGGKGLETPTITTSGNAATVTFFWHADGGEVSSCTYELNCETSSNCGTKSVAVVIPDPMGRTGWSGSFDIHAVDLGDGNYMVSNAYCFTSCTGSQDLLDANSQWRAKVAKHETSHEPDYTGGSSSLLALQGNTVGDTWLVARGYAGTVRTALALNTIRFNMGSHIQLECIGPEGNWTSWTEKRAYAADKGTDPQYFEH